MFLVSVERFSELQRLLSQPALDLPKLHASLVRPFPFAADKSLDPQRVSGRI